MILIQYGAPQLNLVGKPPSYGRMVMISFHIMMTSTHIMSIRWEMKQCCWSLEMRESPCFYRYGCARSRQGRVGFSADAGLDLEKLSEKIGRLCSEISLRAMLRAIQNNIARLRAVKQYSDAATLLLCGAAAGGCQTQFNNCDKGSS